MSRARELAKVGGKNQQVISGLSTHVGISTFAKDVVMYEDLTVNGNTAVGGNLTVTGTTAFNGGTLTLGDAATDNVVFGGDVNSNIIPNTDNAYDLGSSSQEWKDLYIDGTANIDSLVADTADINGGTVDGATVGANSASTGAFTTLSASGQTDLNGDINLGNAATDSITPTGRFDAHIIPLTDGAVDLGASGVEFKDLYIDGTAHIDTLDVDANAGIIGDLSVGGDAAVTGTFDVDGATTLDGLTVAEGATFSTTLGVTGTTTLAGQLDANGDVNLGNATTDSVTVTGRFDSDLLPIADGTSDLGSSTLEWQDLYIDGTANIDSLVADTADINGGTVDGATIGANSASSGAFTTLTASGNVDLGDATSDTITPTGRFDAALVPATDNAIDLGTSALEYKDLYLDGTANIDSLVADTADINGGTIDAAVIGGSTAAAGSFTTVAASSNATITGNLDVDGDTTLDTTDVAGTLTVVGSAVVDNVTVNGNTVSTSSGNLTLDSTGGTVAVADNATVSGNLTVTGTTTLSTALANSNLANSAVTVTAGDGLTGGGSISLGGSATLNVQVDDSSIETDSDTMRVKAGGITNAMLAGSITNAKLAGSITNGKLSNSTVSYGGVSLSLGGSDGTPAFNLADATGLPISSGVSGLASNVATFLGTPSSANLRSALTDETGTGAAVFAGSPTLTGTVVAANLDISGNIDVDGVTNLDVVDIDGSLDVDGHLNADNVSVAGVSTFTGATTFTGAIDANGGASLDNVQVGVTNDNEIDTSSGNLVIDSAGGTTTVDDNLVISGNLTVNGTTNTVNSTTVTIADKNFQVATGAADDAAADGGGLTVDSGDGDKTWNFEATGDNWGSSENINIASGKSYKINNSAILNATTLGSSVVASSLTSVGTIASGVWNGTAITNANLANSSVAYGGVTLSLGGSDATPAFDLSDATNYPTSSLSGTITNAQLAGSITNAKLAGSITNGKLSNSAVTVTAGNALSGGGSISLGGSATLNVAVDDSSIEVNTSSDSLNVKAGGVTNAMLAGSITNAKLAGSIADSKLSTISTANKVSISALNIDGGTDIGADITNFDEIIIDDGGGGTNRRSDMTRVRKYINTSFSSAFTVASDGTATLANSGVTGATYGSSTAIPIVTVNSKGLITSATTTAVDSTTIENGSASVAVAADGPITSTGNHDFTAGIDVTGNITVTGTVDGRDVASDGSKLDGIESSATADQSAAEIRTLVESASDSNVFTDADHSKLNGIEASATADQSAAEIRALVESASDSNVFTDADHSKLNGIAASATNVTNNNQLTNGAGYITSSGSCASATNSDTVDSLHASSFIRSDAADTFSGDLTSSGGARLILKKTDNNVSDHIQFYNGTTRMGEIGTEDTTWLRINQETNKNIYTPRYIRADAGFFVDGTSKGINGSGNYIGGTIAGASDYSTLLRSNTNDTMSGNLTMAGNITPDANGTRNLGASGTRWANIYSSDVDLSNEARGGNTVDGSWGSYLIEEGENDLFLKNRRTGKQYKFVLQEV